MYMKSIYVENYLNSLKIKHYSCLKCYNLCKTNTKLYK